MRTFFIKEFQVDRGFRATTSKITDSTATRMAESFNCPEKHAKIFIPAE